MVSKTIARIRSEGYDALAGAPGPEDATQFSRSYDLGSDYYTKEREKIFRKKSEKQIRSGIAGQQKLPGLFLVSDSRNNGSRLHGHVPNHIPSFSRPL